MKDSHEFLSKVLNSMTDHVVVIDEGGVIEFVNKSWLMFGHNNASIAGSDWKGVNYIKECDKASARGDKFGLEAGNGIRSVIEKKQAIFYFEYPCHSPAEKRWFMMRVSSFEMEDKNYFVIAHQNITERKLAEEAVRELAGLDSLTNMANRRTFDNFLHEEWKRCSRLNKPISLAIVDLDYFKLLNDTYGHQSGDECLIRIGSLLKDFTSRPSDICARYGGEEFALVWGDTSLEQAKSLSTKLLKKIADLNIDNRNSPTESYLTASIGLAEMIPSVGVEESELISKADERLYRAKISGRNRVVS